MRWRGCRQELLLPVVQPGLWALGQEHAGAASAGSIFVSPREKAMEGDPWVSSAV